MILWYFFRPDRYVALFGEFTYDPAKWRPSVPFAEQLGAFRELIDEGKVISAEQFMFNMQICDSKYMILVNLRLYFVGQFEIAKCKWKHD